MQSSVEVKILVVGRKKVGKTALVDRLSKKSFNPNTRATIGVETVTINLLLGGTQVTAYIWDVQGQEQHGTMRPVYYRGAHAMICVFSVDPLDLEDSRKQAEDWKRDVDSRVTQPDGSPIPTVLVGNKIDMGPSLSQDTIHMQFVEANKFVAYIETSAKENIKVTEAFEEAIREAVRSKLALDPPTQPPVSNPPIIPGHTPHAKGSSENSSRRTGGCCH